MSNLKSSFYCFATLDRKGLITDIGGKVFANQELDKNLLVGKYLPEAVFWNHSENASQNIANSIVLAGQGKSLEFETTFWEGSDKISTIIAEFIPQTSENGQIENIIFTSIDITKYVSEISLHKTKSEQLLYAAEFAEVGLWFWNLKTGEMVTTPRCNEIYGFSPSEIMTIEKFSTVFHPEDVPRIEEALAASHNNLEDYNIEYRILVDDDIRWVSVIGKVFQEDAETKVMMGSVRDTTHRKLANEQLKLLYNQAQLAKEEVEEVNRQKDDFLAIVSHELRSPLNSILGWAKILNSKQVDEETKKNALETIENSAKLQAKLISDLVDSAKIISGKLEFNLAAVPLHSIINQVYQSEKPTADEKKINFLLGRVDNVNVMGDTSRLMQAISNLVSNSIKFTPFGGDIILSLVAQNNNAVISVCDTGSGIPEDELPKVFKQYFQSKTAQNKTGLGLGLSIVKVIVEKHGGQVYVKNNDDGIGCTFSVSLPIQFVEKERETITETKAENTNPLQNLEILIVEDNQDSREVLEFYLSQLGAKIHSAASSQEGYNYLTSGERLPEVIVSDISMPDEDGYTFLTKVRALPAEKGGNIPAIALTAFASASDTQKIMSVGFQKHHTKPFEPDVLVEDILSVINKR